MNFKEFRKGVTGQVEKENAMFRIEYKIPFKTNLFLLAVWVFYAKWVYLVRGIKGKKNDN